VSAPLVEARALRKVYATDRGLFGRPRRLVRAVDGVSLAVRPRETLALVGESGSGKSTLGRLLLRLEEPTAGDVRFEGESLLALRGAALRRRRRRFQMVFQDPWGSLNPRLRVGAAVGEGLRIHRIVPRQEVEGRVRGLLGAVGLPDDAAGRFPHELSGGQRQRVGIARALATEPAFVVLDEAVAALDVSVRAGIVNLLLDLKEERGLAYLFIAHDLELVERVADRVAVLYLGRIVEEADTADLFREPLHPYTRALLAAIPVPDPARRQGRVALPGDPPDPAAPPAGCAFHPRCPLAEGRCRTEEQALADAGPGRRVACWKVE
jgi:peptide/nickel transport system ATP-binding protein